MSVLDLFTVLPTQTSIETGVHVEYHPLATITQNGPIEYVIKGTGEDYLDLTNSYLHVQAKITKPDGTDLDESDDETVAPVNLWMHALFSEVDVSLNGTAISTSTNTYSYRAYLETLLNYGRDSKESQLALSMFYKSNETETPFSLEKNSKALQRRRIRTKRSNVVDMVGRIHSDIFTQDKLILDNISLRLRFVRSKDTFSLLAKPKNEGETTPQYKVKIVHSSLFIRKVKVNPAIVLAHAKALQTSTAKYPIKRVVLKVFSVPQGNMNIVQDNLFLSQKPNRLVIGLVDSKAYNGDYSLSPFEFKHYNINSLSLYLDGVQVPSKALKPDFENDCYARSYHTLFTGTGMAWKDFGNFIKYKQYKEGNTLFCFDLTPSLSEGDMVELPKSVSLRLEIGFSKPLNDPAHIIIFGEQDSLIEIDKSRQVITDFTA